MHATEGRIDVDGGRVWYRTVGTGEVPLLVLHGGPGTGRRPHLRRVLMAATVENPFQAELEVGAHSVRAVEDARGKQRADGRKSIGSTTAASCSP